MTTDTQILGNRQLHWSSLIRALWAFLTVLALIFFVFAATARYRELAQIATTPAIAMLKFVVTPEAGYAPLQLAAADVDALLALGLSASWYAGYITLWEGLLIGASLLVGVLILWRRGDDLSTGFSALTYVLIGLFFAPATTAPVRADPAWYLPVLSVLMLGSFCAVTLCFTFPTGQFVPRWTRSIAGFFAFWVVSIFFYPAANPYNWPLAPLTVYFISLSTVLAFAQIYRYQWVSTPMQRQQAKWFVFGATATLVGTGILNLDVPGLIWPMLKQPGLPHVLYNLVIVPIYIGVAMLPTLTISLAILQYHLWDIDILIRRTLIYTILTVMLALLYFGSVVLFQQLVQPFVGQGETPLVTVASTLALAALFTPLRRRVQNAIDRRFYRRKVDTEQVLATFNATLRDEVALDKLTTALLGVMIETLQPAQVSLWLCTPQPIMHDETYSPKVGE